jgi:hypothetical protein
LIDQVLVPIFKILTHALSHLFEVLPRLNTLTFPDPPAIEGSIDSIVDVPPATTNLVIGVLDPILSAPAKRLVLDAYDEEKSVEEALANV